LFLCVHDAVPYLGLSTLDNLVISAFAIFWLN